MVSLAIRSWATPVAALSTLIVLGFPARRAAAEPPQPTSQTHINEMAAALLRAHRALIEEPGLRRDGEHLEAYMERIAGPLPGESDARYRARVGDYVTAVERAADAGKLCVAIPTLRDNSALNTRYWSHACRANGLLPGLAIKVRAAWVACVHGGVSGNGARRLAAELTQTVRVIKTAYEALREARP